MKLSRNKAAWGVVVLMAAWFAMGALRPRLLVTLDAENEDLRDVVRRLERQTSQTILVHKDLTGRVTLNVRRMPLEGVLMAISEQVSARWTAFYPLYSSKPSLTQLIKKLSGDPGIDSHVWTNAETKAISAPGGMDDSFGPPSPVITLDLQKTDLDMTAVAVRSFSQAKLVPENGTKANITLKAVQMPVPKAVKLIAQQANRQWTRFFVLEPRPKMPSTQLARPNRPPPGGGPGMPPPPLSEAELAQLPSDQREQARKTQEFMRQQMEAQLQSMSPGQRAQAMQQRQQMEAMRNMSPAQRQQAMSQMGGPGGGGPGGGGPGGGGGGPSGGSLQSGQQLNSALLNSTSDQRVEKARQMRSK